MAKQTIQLRRKNAKRRSWEEKTAKKENKAQNLAEEVMKNRYLLPETLRGVSSAKTRARFKSAKILRIISEKKPKMLYRRMDFFVSLLDSENNILKWIAIDVLANLTPADSNNKFEKVFRKYYDYLTDESMVTAAHVIDNSGKIAQSKPHLQRRITTELLKVESIPREQECKNILLGRVILAFSKYIDRVRKKKMISFARRQLRNRRNATRRKAQNFLKRFAEA